MGRRGSWAWSVVAVGVASLLVLATLHVPLYRLRCPDDAWALSSDVFEDFDNDRGSPIAIVPNIVHFIRIDESSFSFVDIVCVLAALKHQNPDRIYFHTNVNFTGPYWGYLMETPKFVQIYEIIIIKNLTDNIFEQKLSNIWYKKHIKDIYKILILIEYGGIILDNNVYIVKNVDKFRHFEMVLSWDDERFFGTQLLIAHPDARFPRLWLESYRGRYQPQSEDFNSRVRPARDLLLVRPKLAHLVRQGLFGDQDLTEKLNNDDQHHWSRLKNYYAINLKSQNKKSVKSEINHKNAMNLRSTFGVMVREVYFDA